MAFKIAILIPTCKADKEKEEICKQTWAQNPKIEIRFFHAEELGLIEKREDLCKKMLKIFEWALNNNYDYIFKCDTDTYVWIDRLLNSNYQKFDYVGNNDGVHADGGSGYWLSRKALKVLSKGDTMGETWNEDIMVGKKLFEAGIKVHTDRRYTWTLGPEINNDKRITLHALNLTEMVNFHSQGYIRVKGHGDEDIIIKHKKDWSL